MWLCKLLNDTWRWHEVMLGILGTYTALYSVTMLTQVFLLIAKRLTVSYANLLLYEVNAYYRWVKLVIMPDGAVNMRADAVVSEETAGGVCVELFLRMMKAVDDVYPKIMKALCP